jgi:hypothetical protein
VDKRGAGDDGGNGEDRQRDRRRAGFLAKPTTAMTNAIEPSAAPMAARPDMRTCTRCIGILKRGQTGREGQA